MSKKPTVKRGSVHLPFEVMLPLIRESLAAGQAVCLSPRGVSMRPLIREGRDVLTLLPPPAALKKNDLALFAYGDRYLIHRVVGTTAAGTYNFCGDNAHLPERGVAHTDVIAVVSEIKRNGKPVKTAGAAYAAYLAFIRLRRRFSRAAHRLFHRNRAGG